MKFSETQVYTTIRALMVFVIMHMTSLLWCPQSNS